MAAEGQGTPGNGVSKDLTVKEAYFASLSEWAQQFKAAQMFPSYMRFNYTYNCPQYNRQTPQPAPVRPQFNPIRLLEEVEQRDLIRRFGGKRMLTAPFWRRTVAEIVDALIVFILKVTVYYICSMIFNADLEKNFGYKTVIDENPIMAVFVLSIDILSLSVDLIAIILITKLAVCLYECLWITYNNGATPGKALMNIRVIYVEAMVPMRLQVAPQFIFQNRREKIWAFVYPIESPCLIRSFFRSFIKNMILSVFFPVCVLIMFVKNNRTTYDIITKTVVVVSDSESEPISRHHYMLRPH